MTGSGLTWLLFNVFILVMLAIDLGVMNRKTHVISVKEALLWTGLWIFLAMVFFVGLHIYATSDIALKFLTGYLIEKSLSLDNVFVFLLIFTYFRVPAEYQHKVLFWGILGALVMRVIFIFAGVALLQRFHWMIYLFGAFLIFTGLKMLFQKDKEINPERNPILLLVRRFVPVTKNYHQAKFYIREKGKLVLTPLFIVLIVIETSDLIFALDSIPAILAVTQDPFIVYSANAFAILGLRALYFALAGVMRIFHYLHYGLSLILVFIGTKMMLEGLIEIPLPIVLGFITFIIAASVVASLLNPKPVEELPVPDEVPKDELIHKIGEIKKKGEQE
ncbi:MAG: TerC family protein [Balneolales bacterium]